MRLGLGLGLRLGLGLGLGLRLGPGLGPRLGLGLRLAHGPALVVAPEAHQSRDGGLDPDGRLVGVGHTT